MGWFICWGILCVIIYIFYGRYAWDNELTLVNEEEATAKEKQMLKFINKIFAMIRTAFYAGLATGALYLLNSLLVALATTILQANGYEVYD
jgi:ATP/ADP translocase